LIPRHCTGHEALTSITSIMTEQGGVEDPFDWEVEQIITHLYDVNSPWARSGKQRLPPAEILGQSLRQNRYDGEVLLDASKDDLTTDLGLCRGELKTVTNAVDIWRRQSRRHQDLSSRKEDDFGSIVRRYLSQQPPLETFNRFQSGAPSPNIPHTPFTGQREPMSGHFEGSGLHARDESAPAKNLPVNPFLAVESTSASKDHDNVEDQATTGEESTSYVDTDAGKKRLRLSHMTTTALPDSKTGDIDQSNVQVAIDDQERNESPTQSATLSSDHIPEEAQDSAPTLQIREDALRGEEGSGLGLIDDEDVSVEVSENLSMDQNTRVTADRDGKKRVAPTFLNGPEHTERPSRSDDEAHTEVDIPRQPNLQKGYLGAKGFSAEKVFFGNMHNGEESGMSADSFLQSPTIESENTTDFTLASFDHISSGKRLYVANLMKSFLNGREQIWFERDHKTYIGIMPYADRLGRKHHERSFLMFPASNTNATSASKESLSKWPEFVEASSNVTMDNEGMENAWLNELDILQRNYERKDENDKILPVLGESDLESGRDSDTQQELDAKHSTREKIHRSTKKKLLFKNQVNKIIDQYLDDFAEQWQDRHFNMDSKAWRTWATHHQQPRKFRKQILLSLQTRLDLLTTVRLPKIKEAILKETWTSIKRVQNQCKSFDILADERQNVLWELLILQAGNPPPKPPSKPSKRPATLKTTDWDVNEGFDEESPQDGSMDDFIVDEEDVNDRPGSVDGGLEMDVDSSSDESIRPPVPTNRLHQRSKSRRSYP
jgi:hypothetical protein